MIRQLSNVVDLNWRCRSRSRTLESHSWCRYCFAKTLSQRTRMAVHVPQTRNAVHTTLCRAGCAAAFYMTNGQLAAEKLPP